MFPLGVSVGAKSPFSGTTARREKVVGYADRNKCTLKRACVKQIAG
jgi:hypothetical protein